MAPQDGQDGGQDSDAVLVADHDHVAPHPPGLEVHAVDDTTRRIGADDPHDGGGHRLLRLLGGGADVGGGDDVGMPDDRGVEFGGHTPGLVVEDVQSRSDVLAVHRRQQCLGVDEPGPCGVQQDRTRGHRRQNRGVHHLLGAREVQRQHVADRRHLHEVVVQRDVEFLDALADPRVTARAPEGVQAHAEPGCPLGDGHAGAAQPDDAQRPALEAAGTAVARLVPGAAPQVARGIGDVTVQRHHEAHREFRHRHGVATRRVADVDPASRGRGHVDVVESGTGPHDERQRAGGGDGLGGDGRAAHDEHVELAAGQQRPELARFHLRLVDALEALGSELRHSAGVARVGEQDPDGQILRQVSGEGETVAGGESMLTPP